MTSRSQLSRPSPSRGSSWLHTSRSVCHSGCCEFTAPYQPRAASRPILPPSLHLHLSTASIIGSLSVPRPGERLPLSYPSFCSLSLHALPRDLFRGRLASWLQEWLYHFTSLVDERRSKPFFGCEPPQFSWRPLSVKLLLAPCE